MEALRLFLLKIILSAIILNVILAENTMAYKTISVDDGMLATKFRQQPAPNPGAHRRNWSQKSSNMYKNMPPYLVFNQKVGAYYPYYKYPYQNNLRRTGVQKTRQ